MTNLLNSELFIHIFLVVISGVLVRALPILLITSAKASDTCFHLYLIRAIYENNRKVPEYYTRMAEELRMSYPPFLHYLLSYIPRNYTDTILKFVNPVLDTIVTVFIFLALWMSNGDFLISWLGALLYLFSPLIFSHQATGPRIADFTPRVFGEFLFFITTYCMLMADNIVFVICGGAVASLIFMSSQFSAQVILLTIPIAIFLGASVEIIAIPIIGLLGAICVGQKRFYRAFMDKLRHYRWYFSEILSSKISGFQRSWFKGIFVALRGRSFEEIYRELFQRNSLAILIIKAPFIVYCVYLFNFSDSLQPFILASLTLFIITSTKYFLFLGEAERYIVHYFPIFIIAAVTSLNNDIIICFILYGGLFYFFDIFMLYYKKKFLPLNQKSKVVLNYLNEQSDKKMVATNPIHLGGWKILSDTEHSIVGLINSIHGNNSFFISYNMLDESKLDEAAQYYKFDLIFFDGKLITSIDKVRQQLSQFKEIILEEGVILFEKQTSPQVSNTVQALSDG